MTDPGTEVVAVGDSRPGIVTLDVLRYLGLDPHDIEARALVLLCSRYGLDPLLGHVSVISTRNGQRVYVTRDGLLAVAHRSGRLDGIEVLEERRSSTNDGWTARVAVWVKGCSKPFTYGAQCKDSEPQAKAGNGPEMALARAERRALRRAFSVPADTIGGDDGGESGYDLDAIADDVVELPARAEPGGVRFGEASAVVPRVEPARAADGSPPLGLSAQSGAHRAVANWSMDDQRAFLAEHGIEDFGSIWSTTAVLAALERDTDSDGAG